MGLGSFLKHLVYGRDPTLSELNDQFINNIAALNQPLNNGSQQSHPNSQQYVNIYQQQLAQQQLAQQQAYYNLQPINVGIGGLAGAMQTVNSRGPIFFKTHIEYDFNFNTIQIIPPTTQGMPVVNIPLKEFNHKAAKLILDNNPTISPEDFLIVHNKANHDEQFNNKLEKLTSEDSQ